MSNKEAGMFVSSKYSHRVVFYCVLQVLVPIGYGTEEMEAAILIYVLRQAGAHVTVASVEPKLEVEASGGLKLVADTFVNSCANEIFDLIALPVST